MKKSDSSFNEVIHSPTRLRICGVLRRASEVEFSMLRDTLELSDANLSKGLKVLAESGYVKIRKESSATRADARRLTWVALTPEGRKALDGHIAALRQMAGD